MFSKQADCSLTAGFSVLKSPWYSRETGPWSYCKVLAPTTPTDKFPGSWFLQDFLMFPNMGFITLVNQQKMQ